MASSSKRPKTPHPKKCSIDRLSSLPDDVLHRVLSSVDLIEIVRASVLSKRWRRVWTSMPYLNFDMKWFMKQEGGDTYNRYKFWDSIKWALLLRDASQITRISLYIDELYYEETEKLVGLLRAAARQKVQELCFQDRMYFDGIEVEIPRVLCETLTVLKVDSHETPLRIPAVFSNLRNLYLKAILISSDVAEKLLSSDCIKLENVHLEDCKFKDLELRDELELINISACNLKNLTIENMCHWDSHHKCSFESKLRICAPNLLSFYYTGPMLSGFELVNTVSLKHVSILLRPEVWEDDDEYLPCPARFIGLNHSKALTVSSFVVEYFSPAYTEPLWDTSNLNYLELHIRYNVNDIEGMINLMKCSPNLEVLVIRLEEYYWSDTKTMKANESKGPWKSRIEDIACLSHHVKIIEVSNLEVELVKFLLQNGKVLEKMEIVYSEPKYMQRFKRKLAALPKASSEVVIYYPEYARRSSLAQFQ